MVSMGKTVYLAVPGHTSLVEGHCLIVPMTHYTAGLCLSLIKAMFVSGIQSFIPDLNPTHKIDGQVKK